MSALLADFQSLGDPRLLERPLLAIFSSAKCPASLILKAHDYAKAIRNGDTAIIGGFHAPAEKEVLEVLLKGTCPTIIILGRRLKNARIPTTWKGEIEKGRLLVISPFKDYQAFVTKEISRKRNDLAARIAGRVLVVYASEGGSLQSQIQRWQSENIIVDFLK